MAQAPVDHRVYITRVVNDLSAKLGHCLKTYCPKCYRPYEKPKMCAKCKTYTVPVRALRDFESVAVGALLNHWQWDPTPRNKAVAYVRLMFGLVEDPAHQLYGCNKCLHISVDPGDCPKEHGVLVTLSDDQLYGYLQRAATAH